MLGRIVETRLLFSTLEPCDFTTGASVVKPWLVMTQQVGMIDSAHPVHCRWRMMYTAHIPIVQTMRQSGALCLLTQMWPPSLVGSYITAGNENVQPVFVVRSN